MGVGLDTIASLAAALALIVGARWLSRKIGSVGLDTGLETYLPAEMAAPETRGVGGANKRTPPDTHNTPDPTHGGSGVTR